MQRQAERHSRTARIWDNVNQRGSDRAGVASVDISPWLHSLGMQRYEEAFRANEIDAGVLLTLTSKDLGVTLVGHRRRLLDAIAG